MSKVTWEEFRRENASDIRKASQLAGSILKDDNIAQSIHGSDKTAEALFAMLNDNDREKLSQIIKNPEILESILSSPKARENLKKLMGK